MTRATARRVGDRLIIRPERCGDAAGVEASRAAAWRVGFRDILPAAVLDALDVVRATERRERHFDDSNGWQTMVAEVDGTVVGHVTYGPDPAAADTATGQILSCYVSPEFWGTGISGTLMTAALTAMLHRRVRLWVLEANQRARRFYERHGFTFDGTRDIYTRQHTDVALPNLRYSRVVRDAVATQGVDASAG